MKIFATKPNAQAAVISRSSTPTESSKSRCTTTRRPPERAHFRFNLLPLTLHRKGCPVIWRVPTLGFPHSDLSGPECCCGFLVTDNHCLIKRFHESGGGPVIDGPQTCEHAWRPCIEESTCEPD